MKPGVERLDVTIEELESAAREGTGTAGRSGVPETAGGDPHPGLRNRVAGESGGDAGGVAAPVVPGEHGEDRARLEAGGR